MAVPVGFRFSLLPLASHLLRLSARSLRIALVVGRARAAPAPTPAPAAPPATPAPPAAPAPAPPAQAAEAEALGRRLSSLAAADCDCGPPAPPDVALVVERLGERLALDELLLNHQKTASAELSSRLARLEARQKEEALERQARLAALERECELDLRLHVVEALTGSPLRQRPRGEEMELRRAAAAFDLGEDENATPQPTASPAHWHVNPLSALGEQNENAGWGAREPATFGSADVV